MCEECLEFYEGTKEEAERKAEEKKREQERLKEERKRMYPPQQNRLTSVRLTNSSLDDLDRIAKEVGVSRNALIQRAIDAFLVM